MQTIKQSASGAARATLWHNIRSGARFGGTPDAFLANKKEARSARVSFN
jgi:hypothetical protein